MFEEKHLEHFGERFLVKNKLNIKKSHFIEKKASTVLQIGFFPKKDIHIKANAKATPFMRFYQVI